MFLSILIARYNAGMNDYVGLLDCNNFFVSCERLFRPDLLGKPVIVLSGNDGCVVARSQEAKALGIPMGAPVFQIKKELAAAKVVQFSSNFTLYRDISARIMRTLRSLVRDMEQYSIDEAFFTLSQTQAEDETYLRTLKQHIERVSGVPVSIGVAQSKTLSKIASHTAKQGSGVYYLSATHWNRVAAETPVYELWGVGRSLSAKFTEYGLDTAADILAADPARIARLFGIAGVRLQAELAGSSKSRSHRVLPQSVMSSRSFPAVTNDLIALESALAGHISQVSAKLRKADLVATALSVHARPSRHGNFVLQGFTESVQLSTPSNDTAILLHTAVSLLRTHFSSAVPYQKVGVVVTGLIPTIYQSTSLFSDEVIQKSVDSILDTVTQKYGTHALGYYKTKRDKAVSKHTHYSGALTTSWKDIPTVLAK